MTTITFPDLQTLKIKKKIVGNIPRDCNEKPKFGDHLMEPLSTCWQSSCLFLFKLCFQWVHISPTGLKKIQGWIIQSLKRRLNKSLSHDWIPEKSSHKFPLRKYYVQLEWKQKVRTAMGSESVVLTSLHDFIKQIGGGTCDMNQQAEVMHHQYDGLSVIVEGNWSYQYCYQT